MRPELAEVANAAKGWLHPEEGPELYRLGCLAAPHGPLVEIGAYCGKSACWLGEAARQHNTVLFSVDHHRGNPEMRAGQDCHDPDVLDSQGRHDSLPLFRRTIADADLEDHVVAVVAPSLTLARFWSAPIGLVFIDGGHDDRSARDDVAAWWPHVADGGFLVAHDATIPGIARAVRQADGEVSEVGCMKVVRKC